MRGPPACPQIPDQISKTFQARRFAESPGLKIVAGAGFEPATSGRDRGACDNYGVKTVATGFACFARETGLLPVTGYPSDTDPEQLNLDPKWTLVDSGHAVNRHSPPQPRAR